MRGGGICVPCEIPPILNWGLADAQQLAISRGENNFLNFNSHLDDNTLYRMQC